MEFEEEDEFSNSGFLSESHQTFFVQKSSDFALKYQKVLSKLKGLNNQEIGTCLSSLELISNLRKYTDHIEKIDIICYCFYILYFSDDNWNSYLSSSRIPVVLLENFTQSTFHDAKNFKDVLNRFDYFSRFIVFCCTDNKEISSTISLTKPHNVFIASSTMSKKSITKITNTIMDETKFNRITSNAIDKNRKGITFPEYINIVNSVETMIVDAFTDIIDFFSYFESEINLKSKIESDGIQITPSTDYWGTLDSFIKSSLLPLTDIKIQPTTLLNAILILESKFPLCFRVGFQGFDGFKKTWKNNKLIGQLIDLNFKVKPPNRNTTAAELAIYYLIDIYTTHSCIFKGNPAHSLYFAEHFIENVNLKVCLIFDKLTFETQSTEDYSKFKNYLNGRFQDFSDLSLLLYADTLKNKATTINAGLQSGDFGSKLRKPNPEFILSITFNSSLLHIEKSELNEHFVLFFPNIYVFGRDIPKFSERTFRQNVPFIHPEYLYILRTYGATNSVIGFITNNGNLHSWHMSSSEIQLLDMFRKNIRVTFSVLGKSCSSCMMCKKKLENQFSIDHGFGPVCAKRWDLLLKDEEYDQTLSEVVEENVFSTDSMAPTSVLRKRTMEPKVKRKPSKKGPKSIQIESRYTTPSPKEEILVDIDSDPFDPQVKLTPILDDAKKKRKK